MKRCAFLTLDDPGDYYIYDNLLFEPMAKAGWQVQEVPWRSKSVKWDDFDVVVIRSPWDYQQDPEAFLACLERIEAGHAELANSLDVVRWNINKSYLQALQDKGIAIAPSAFFDDFDLQQVQQCFTQFASEQLVIKPLVSANADDTFRLTAEQVDAQAQDLLNCFAQRAHIIQPFIPSIVAEGEYSLFYFGNVLSHAVLKVPAKGDFRTQEEHGGSLRAITPEPALVAAGSQTLAAIPYDTLYARLDYARYNGEFVVMEAELIEPSLYFNMDPSSPQRFVDAFLAQFGGSHY